MVLLMVVQFMVRNMRTLETGIKAGNEGGSG